MNIGTTTACAVALVWVVVLGVGAASAAASAAAFRRVRSFAEARNPQQSRPANKITGTAAREARTSFLYDHQPVCQAIRSFLLGLITRLLTPRTRERAILAGRT